MKVDFTELYKKTFDHLRVSPEKLQEVIAKVLNTKTK